VISLQMLTTAFGTSRQTADGGFRITTTVDGPLTLVDPVIH